MSLLDIVKKYFRHTPEDELRRYLESSESSSRITVSAYMEATEHMVDAGAWTCEACGASPQPDDRWRWSGRRWEHYHGYPMGHIPATKNTGC